MFKKSIILALVFTSIVLYSFSRLYAQEEEGEVIIISEKVGEVIDLEERDNYNLTFRIQGFQSAVFLKLPNESIIKKYRSKIDNFEEMQIKRLSSKGSAIQMKQTVKQKPIIGALGSALLGGVLGGAVGCGIGIILDGVGVGAVGVLVLPLGIASGSTYGIWSWDKENCSPGLTFLGSIVPVAVGAVVGIIILEPVDIIEEAGLVPIIGGSLFGSFLSPLGATIGYALSRHPHQTEPQALLHIEGSKPCIRMPSTTFRPVLLPGDQVAWEYRIKFISMKF